MDKFVLYKGEKFYLQTTGKYYQSGSKRGERLLHRRIWIEHNGEIPKGYHVHHIDHDWRNNEITNLKLVGGLEHGRYHMTKRMANAAFREKAIKSMHKGAIKWHKSSAGREMHSIVAKQGWENKRESYAKSRVCSWCDKEYTAYNENSICCSNSCWQKRYCSNKKAKFICEFCNKEFMAYKYGNNKTCSRSCGAKLRWRSTKRPQ